jgi:S-adenosylhomocysteine hydrolase
LTVDGHFDVEVDVAGLRRAATDASEVRPNAVAYTLSGGGRVVVLADGRLVGQSCAEASPAEVIDLTFATQALAVEHLGPAQPSGRASTRSPPGRPPQAGRARRPLRRPHRRAGGLPAGLANR